MHVIDYSAKDGFQWKDRPELAWEKDEEEEDWLKRLGFEEWPADFIGDPANHRFGHSVSVHFHNDGRRLVYFHTTSNWDLILVANPAEFLSLLSVLGPMLQGLHFADWASDMHSFAKRTFEAWHGHTPEEPCQHCDLEGHRLRTQQDKETRERLAKKQTS